MPPLRTKNDISALIEGIKSGVIEVVSSDHRPKDIERKFKEYDHASFGSIGLESCFGALNAVLDKEIKLEDTIKLICQNPRNRFGVNIPTLEKGQEAEITLFNPEKKYTFGKEHIKSLSANSAFLGKELKGEVYGTYNNKELFLN